jgi:protochlorophyllide reductase
MTAKWTPADIGDQTGKVALVTGANSGLGLVIASLLAQAGATVILGCRNAQKAAQAASQIISLGVREPVEILPLDLGDLHSVSTAAQTFVTSGRPLHLLINNAGLMAVDESKTVDGFEMQFGVNHLGHFALTADLLPVLLSTPASRVVSMSSMGHRMGSMHFNDIMFEKKYDRWKPYFQSKLANLLFTAELHSRLQSAGLHTMALTAHPGGSRTDLGTEGRGITNKLMSSVVPLVTQSAEIGAQPALRAATDQTAASGEFYGPRWIGVGHAVRETPSQKARSAVDAQRLWALSEQLTQRTFLSAAT